MDEEEVKHSIDGSDKSSWTEPNEEVQTKPTFWRRVKNHYKKWWWVHLIVTILLLLLTILLLFYVAFPNIAQDDVNDATLEDITQIITEPTPESVHVVLNTTVHNPSRYTPTLDAFSAAFYLPDAGRENPFGYLQIPRIHARRRTNVTIDQTLEIVDMTQFTEYCRRTLVSDTYEVSLYGRTDLHLGGLPTYRVTFAKTVKLTGLNGLHGLNVTDVSISLTPAADGTNMNGTVFIPNPAALTLSLGNVSLDLSVGNQNVGTTYINDLVLEPGDNYRDIRSTINQSAVLSLISSQYQDGVLPLEITGNSSVYNGLNLPYFEAALRSNSAPLNLSTAPALQAIGVNISSFAD